MILVTTLETNRDEGYGAVSKAPPPSKRYAQFKKLEWPRKVVTVEPAMDFDVEEFAEWLISLKPEYVWLGFNSRPRSVRLPEPSKEKMLALAERLKKAGIQVRGKELWGLEWRRPKHPQRLLMRTLRRKRGGCSDNEIWRRL